MTDCSREDIVSPKDEGIVFRPTFKRVAPAEGKPPPMLRNAVLAAIRRMYPTRGGWGTKTRRAAPCRVAVPLPSTKSRRVVVKAHFVKMSAYGAKASRLHLEYVQREGVEKDGSRGIAYGADAVADPRAFAKPLENERHQFRLIVSPEDARELDMTAFVRRYMAEVEKDIEHPLQWIAVNHYNTDHPHAHIIIRGVDKDGEQIRMERGYISHGLRERAQDMATRELGPRNDLETERHRLHEVDKDRITSLDAEVKRLADRDVVDLRGRRWPRVDENLLVARLKHLEALKLAERQSPCSWRLTPGWQDELRQRARRNDIMDRMDRWIGADRSRYEIDGPQEGNPERPPVLARLVHKAVCDDRANSYGVILETADGRGLYSSMDARQADKVRQGDLVMVEWAATAKEQDGQLRAPQLRVSQVDLRLEEQISYPGAVWLDRVARGELRRGGLGSEVAKAAAERDRFLQSKGMPADLAPSDPRREGWVLELERFGLGERRGREEQEVFLKETPEGFRGRVSLTEPTRNGLQYAAISNGDEFVLVAVTRELKMQIGKQVELNAEGTFVVRSRDRGMDR
jgi:type IV secretory pathway VirD2 relaxase